LRVSYIGHSSVLIELDGLRLITDPVLRGRVLHIVREAPAVDLEAIGKVDFVVVSHLHHDHFDPASLRMISNGAELIVPRNARRMAARLGFENVIELGVGESATPNGITVTATPALHRKGRILDRRSEAIGYTIAGTQRVYFAGDTDLFSGMKALRGEIDLALLPVGGWGPTLGPGHLDARRAAEALALLEPRVAVPIHWGTLHRIGLRRVHRALQSEQPRIFAREAATLAPSVDVRVLEPGEATTVEPAAV
jgi:L-ascorbate metabolism protein UlaG (beta-lactamase superfamily)